MKKVNLILSSIALMTGLNLSAQEQVKPESKEQPAAVKAVEKKDVSIDSKKGIAFKKIEIEL